MSYKTVIEVGGEKRIIAGSSKEAVERAIKTFYGGSNSKGADESKSAEPKKTIEYSAELEHPVTKEKITLKASSKDELKTSIERKAKELYGSFSEVREVDSGFEIITKVPESYEPFVRRASKTEFTIPRTPEEAVNYPKNGEVKVSVSETFEKPKNFSVPSSVKLVEKPYELEPTPKTESFGSSVQKASEKIEKAVSDRAAPMRFLTGVAVGAGTAVLAPAIIAETVATSSKPVKSLTEGVALWASSVPLRLASKDPFLMGTAVGELGSVAISPKFTPKVFRSIKTVSEVYTGFSRTGSPELVFKSTRGILGDTSKIGILKEELISRETGKEVPILEFERERGFLFPLVEEGGALKTAVKKVKTEPKTEAPSVTPMLKIEIFPMSKTVVVGTKSDVGSKISALKIETPSPDVLRGRYLRFEGTPENFLVRAEERSVERVATEVRKSRIRKTVEVKGNEIRTSGFIERGQSIQKHLVIGYEKASGKVTKKPITEKYRVSYQEIDLSVPKVTMHTLAPFTRTEIIPTPDVTKIYRGFRDYTVKSYTTEFSAGLPLIGFLKLQSTSLFNGLKPSLFSGLKTELKTTPKSSLKLKEVPVEIDELKPTEKQSIFTKTTEKTEEVLKFTPKTSAKTTSSLKTPQTTTSIEVPTIPPNRVSFFPAFGGKEGSKLKKLDLKFKGFSLKTDVVPLADWYAVTATEIMFKKTPRVRRPEKKAEYKEKMERLGFALTFPTQEIEKIMKKKGRRKK